MLSRWWRKSSPAPIDSDLWRRVLRRHRYLRRLNDDQRETLRHLAGRFLAEKTLSGAQGLQLTPLRAALLASMACLPVLRLGFDWLQGWRELIV